MYANNEYPDQTPRTGLDMHFLPISHKKDARLIWVKETNTMGMIFSYLDLNKVSF